MKLTNSIQFKTTPFRYPLIAPALVSATLSTPAFSAVSIAISIALTIIGTTPSFAQAPSLQTRSSFRSGEVIVHWKENSQSKQKRARGSLHARRLSVAHEFAQNSTQHLRAEDGRSTEEVLSEMQNDPDVAWAEPNYMISLSVSSPQVVVSGSSGSSTSASSTGTFSLTTAPVMAQQAWSSFTPASSTLPIVAVLDSGADITHPALQNAIAINAGEIPSNGIDDDGNGYIDDVYGWNYVNGNSDVSDCLGHGTHVSGIVRGVGQSITSSPAPSPLVQILPVKFLDCTGNGDTGNAANAIYYAVARGAKVINASWGGAQYSRALHEAIAYAYSKSVVFVAAAGNNATNDDATPTYPASLDVPNIIAVAATDASDAFASFSNFGAGTVALAAPGVSIFSTYPNGQYAYYSGTSMATPFIAGVSALMIREKPALNSYNVKTLVASSADVLPSLNGKVSSSARLNLQTAVQYAQNVSTLSAQPVYNIANSSIFQRGIASASSSGGSSSGGGCGTVRALSTSAFGDDNEPPIGGIVAISCLLSVPLVALSMFRYRIGRRAGRERRQDERFDHETEISLLVNGVEILARTRDLSLSGLAAVSDMGLKVGDLISLAGGQIRGEVVWSRLDQTFGIRILDGQTRWQSIVSQKVAC